MWTLIGFEKVLRNIWKFKPKRV